MIEISTPIPAPIALQSVSYRHGARTVLSDLSFGFNKNRITAILGNSGSGKTTLLHLVNGMIKPDQGQVLLFGQPIDYRNVHRLRQQIGYVVQQVGLFPHLSVHANITLLSRVIPIAKDDVSARVVQLLDMVGLPHAFLKKYPHELSGGEQQRVGLCRALFLEPPVILMDEPFASLDRETKVNIYNHLLAIQKKESRTIILVTHDWDEAITLADNFIWINEGRIQAQGDHHELRSIQSSYLKRDQ